VGRAGELKALFALVDGLSEQGGALVMSGRPGVGKTSLLGAASRRADDSGALVLSTRAVRSEADLAFAGLHRLLLPLLGGLERLRPGNSQQPAIQPPAPMCDRLEQLPPPQRDALRTSFGLVAGPAPDRLLVGLSVLSLFGNVACDRPLVCVVDDAQWLDPASAQTLAFVARRLSAKRVAVVFAARESREEFTGLFQLEVNGLPDADAGELLAAVLPGPFDERAGEQLISEARGNPMVLLELARECSPAQLAGGFGLPHGLGLSPEIEQSFHERAKPLSHDTLLFLLVAATETTGDARVARRAARNLGIDDAAVELAERSGLLEIHARVRFCHPQVRVAAYNAMCVEDRVRVHAALAEASDGETDPDRCAWHRAQATRDPDDEIAAELERSAPWARRRGGLPAAAAFLARAAAVTVQPARRAERALAAAEAKHLAGAPGDAVALLVAAESGTLDELGRARADLLRAKLAFASRDGSEVLPMLLLRSAKQLEPLDVCLARDTYLEALLAAESARAPIRGRLVAKVARAGVLASPPSAAPRASDLLLEGVATLFTSGYARAAPLLKGAVGAFRSGKPSGEEELRWLSLASRMSALLWDDESYDVLTARHVDIAREAGALPILHRALGARVLAHTLAAEFAAASRLVGETLAVSEAIGTPCRLWGPSLLAAWQGSQADVVGSRGAGTDVRTMDDTLGIAAARWAEALLHNGRRRYADALSALETHVQEQSAGLGLSVAGCLVETVTAAVRSNAPARAAEALSQLMQMTQASGTDWALGIEARSRALVSDGAAAERLYVDAIERLRRTRVRTELARTHLLYGEWLRRERRRVEAREHLRSALEMFAAMGADGFAQRAETELLATGEHARKRSPQTRADLTAQETEIARLARDGLSNPEIGARLFISPRTVEYHLHKVFTKLDISSRVELSRTLPRDQGVTAAV
jgi:DNA-binding CsgD family transcriptional regulator